MNSPFNTNHPVFQGATSPPFEPDPPVLVVESVSGGFIVTASGKRHVAHNVAAIIRILREWDQGPAEPA